MGCIYFEIPHIYIYIYRHRERERDVTTMMMIMMIVMKANLNVLKEIQRKEDSSEVNENVSSVERNRIAQLRKKWYSLVNIADNQNKTG